MMTDIVRTNRLLFQTSHPVYNAPIIPAKETAAIVVYSVSSDAFFLDWMNLIKVQRKTPNIPVGTSIPVMIIITLLKQCTFEKVLKSASQMTEAKTETTVNEAKRPN